MSLSVLLLDHIMTACGEVKTSRLDRRLPELREPRYSNLLEDASVSALFLKLCTNCTDVGRLPWMSRR